jgi:hypothetical protein
VRQTHTVSLPLSHTVGPAARFPFHPLFSLLFHTIMNEFILYILYFLFVFYNEMILIFDRQCGKSNHPLVNKLWLCINKRCFYFRGDLPIYLIARLFSSGDKKEREMSLTLTHWWNAFEYIESIDKHIDLQMRNAEYQELCYLHFLHHYQ